MVDVNPPLSTNRAPLYSRTPQQGCPPAETVQEGSPVGEENVGEAELSQRLTAGRIQDAVFPTIRRGYDPKAVQAYLAQVAAEVARLQQRLAAAYAETDRIKRNLRQWQTDHAAAGCGPHPRNNERPPNATRVGRWVTQPPYPARPPHRT